MQIQGIDTDRVKAAVFDLGGVFLEGPVDNVARFGPRVGLNEAVWRAMRHELFIEEGWWNNVERAEMTRWLNAGWVDTFRALHPGETMASCAVL